MQVRYVGPFGSVRVPAISAIVSQGETVDVDDDLGALMCEQVENWEAVGAPAVSMLPPAPVPDPEPAPDNDEV